jgi:hypothetical protein
MYKELLEKRDLQLHQCTDRFCLMERKLVEYSQIIKENGMDFNISPYELKRYFREIVPG